MLTKVCGMRDPENIRAVAGLGIDLMGFIFWDRSPRAARVLPSSVMDLPCRRVGVFVDEDPMNVLAKVKDYNLDFIQLHGHESASYIDGLRRLTDVRIIKAISIREAGEVLRWREYEGKVDMILFDTKCKSVGGSGEKFDWSALDLYDGSIPFLLSGGIGPDDAERVKAFHHPMCAGIDLNSKFEDSPGMKNVEKLDEFIRSLNQ